MKTELKKTTHKFDAKMEWRLMGVDTLPTLYQEVGHLDEDGVPVASIGIAINGAALYLFTEKKHPDDHNRKATYALPLISKVPDALSEIAKFLK